MAIPVSGLLLAAGRATRFGSPKLAAPLRSGADAGTALGVASLKRLASVIGNVIVVVRDDDELAQCFRREGAAVVVATRADDGMGVSLAAGVAALPVDRAVVVALADMPWIEPTTIARVADAVGNGAVVAAPFHDGQRGHPVGFAPSLRDELLALAGDDGARSVLAQHRASLVRIDVDDAGVLRDVDRPSDM
jgi:molybdenum cofactor cytidylyltransferase